MRNMRPHAFLIIRIFSDRVVVVMSPFTKIRDVVEIPLGHVRQFNLLQS